MFCNIFGSRLRNINGYTTLIIVTLGIMTVSIITLDIIIKLRHYMTTFSIKMFMLSVLIVLMLSAVMISGTMTSVFMVNVLAPNKHFDFWDNELNFEPSYRLKNRLFIQMRTIKPFAAVINYLS